MRAQLFNSLHSLVTRRRASSSARGLILMYHRISTVTPDPWALCVSPTHFAEQLHCLCTDFQVLPLQEFVKAQQENTLPPRAVTITFDDGYADNFYNAHPLLTQFGLPATFFIATGYLGQDREFWWDELCKYILESGALPATVSLNIKGKRFEWHLENIDDNAPSVNVQRWRTKKSVSVPSSRQALYQELWQHLYLLPHQMRQQLLAEIAAWMGACTTARESHRTMTPEELCQFAQSPLVEIGGHTVTHLSLFSHPYAEQWKEIQANKQQLETILNRPVETFSYPHGDYKFRTMQLLRAAGFKLACTTDAHPVWRGSNRFRMPRYAIENWDGEEFTKRLNHWLQ